MITPPAQPKIYHITHVENLRAIIGDGRLISDRAMIQRGGPDKAVGMGSIKRRRVEMLEVACHPGTKVGDYVPFYFCPRSIMLYVIHRANHPDLEYRGGQGPIVHLESDLDAVIEWAIENGQPWAFSLANAGAAYTEFRSSRAQLNELNWSAIASGDFSSPDIKEGKQAEFLLHATFPWHLVERIGVFSRATKDLASDALIGAKYSPPVSIQPAWYF